MRFGRVIAAIAAACVAGSVALPRLGEQPAAPAALAGCFANNCMAVGSNVFAEQGQMIDADTWQSAPITGGWTEFSGGDFIYFHGAFGGRVPYDYSVQISVSANPVADNNVLTNAAGNIALVSQIGPDQILVTNGTCSHYFIRVVLFAPPFPPAPPAVDAGDEDAGDAGNDDAGDDDAGAELDGSISDAGL